MNVVLSHEIIEMIQHSSSSENDDINEKIKAICADLAQATSIGQTIYAMYENLANEKKESDERSRQYGVITATTLDELDKIQNRETPESENKESNLNIPFDDTEIKEKSKNSLANLQGLMEQLVGQVYEKELQISSFIQTTQNKIDEFISILMRLARIFSCTPQEIESHANALIEDNNNCRQMLEIIIQNISSQNTNFDSIDSLLDHLGFKETNVQLELSQHFESIQKISEIAGILHCDPQDIKNEINKLIDISFEASKPKPQPQLIQLPPPPAVDTSELEEEIMKLKRENEILSDSQQQLFNEKSNLMQRIASLQSQIDQQSRQPRLSYEHFDYLMAITPSESNNPDLYNPSSMNQDEFDEVLRSKNDMIAQLNYQLQESLNSLKETQENNLTEVNSLRDKISSLQIEKERSENQCHSQKSEIKALRLKIDSLPQSELVRSLSSFFGGCANEEEILNRVYGLKDEISRLNVRVSEYEMNASNMKKKDQNSEDEVANFRRISELKRELDQATEQLESLQEQVSSLQNDNSRLQNDNNTLYQQIQEFRDNEISLREEISSNQRKIRDSTRTCEHLQAEYNQSSSQLSEISKKIETFENESEKLLSSINRVATKIASAPQSNPRTKRKGRPGSQSNGFEDLLNMCQALQTVFMQYTTSEFSNSEKTINDLLSSIEQIQQNGINVQDEDALTNDIMKRIVQEKTSAFMELITGKLGQIYENSDTMIKQFESVKTDILQKIDDQTKELQDYIDNDYSGPYAALKRSYAELQERFEGLTRNSGIPIQNHQEQYGQFEQHHSRFQSSTPPRNPSRGSRSSIQSPSEIVLDRTIQQNYNRSRFYQ